MPSPQSTPISAPRLCCQSCPCPVPQALLLWSLSRGEGSLPALAILAGAATSPSWLWQPQLGCPAPLSAQDLGKHGACAQPHHGLGSGAALPLPLPRAQSRSWARSVHLSCCPHSPHSMGIAPAQVSHAWEGLCHQILIKQILIYQICLSNIDKGIVALISTLTPALAPSPWGGLVKCHSAGLGQRWRVEVVGCRAGSSQSQGSSEEVPRAGPATSWWGTQSCRTFEILTRELSAAGA